MGVLGGEVVGSGLGGELAGIGLWGEIVDSGLLGNVSGVGFKGEVVRSDLGGEVVSSGLWGKGVGGGLEVEVVGSEFGGEIVGSGLGGEPIGGSGLRDEVVGNGFEINVRGGFVESCLDTSDSKLYFNSLKLFIALDMFKANLAFPGSTRCIWLLQYNDSSSILLCRIQPSPWPINYIIFVFAEIAKIAVYFQ